MDRELAERLDHLEARVTALEAQLATPAAPTLVTRREVAAAPPPERPVAAPVQPPPLPAPLAAEPAAPAAEPPPLPAPVAPPRRRGRDLEDFLGLQVLGRIGVAAVLLAAAYFAQLGLGHLTPTLRTAGLYALGAGLIAVGALLRTRTAARYVALLWGGGTAITYLAGLVGSLYYRLLPPGAALPLLVASTAVGQLLAANLRLQSMAVIALAGAFAAPVLVGVDTGTPTAFCGYLLLLHGYAAWGERRWQWLGARRLAVVAAATLAGSWLLGHPALPPWSLVLHVDAMLIGLLLPELFDACRRDPPPAARAGRFALVLAAAWSVQLTLWLAFALRDQLPWHGLAAGAAWLLLGAAVHRRSPDPRAPAAGVSHLGGTLLVLGAVAVHGHGEPLTAIDAIAGVDQAWSRMLSLIAVAAGLFAVRRRTGASDAAVVLAAAFGVAIASQASPGVDGHLQALAALILPAALLRLGAAPPARVAGLSLGAIAAFAAVRLRASFDPPLAWWLPIAAVAAAAWLALARRLAAARGDALPARAAAVQLRGVATAALLPLGIGIGWLAIAALGWNPAAAERQVPHLASIAGPAALAIAALLRRRDAARAWPAARLADVGGLLVLAAAFAANAGEPLRCWQLLGASVAAGLLLLTVARRWTGAGEAAAFAALILAAALVLPQTPDTASRWQTALVATVPAALVLLARPLPLRSLALVLGAGLWFFGTSHARAFAAADGAWLSVAFGLAGGWSALGALRASWTRDRALLATATTLLAALGIGWSILALAPEDSTAPGLTAFWNVRFLAAVTMLGVLELARRNLPATAAVVDRVVFAVVALAVAWLAGLIELLSLVRTWPAGWSDVTISLYTLLFAGGLLIAGFARRQPWLRWPGLAGFVGIAGKVALFDLAGLATPLRVLLTGALGAVLLLGAWGYARLGRDRTDGTPAR